jgi:hypothetical protein
VSDPLIFCWLPALHLKTQHLELPRMYTNPWMCFINLTNTSSEAHIHSVESEAFDYDTRAATERLVPLPLNNCIRRSPPNFQNKILFSFLFPKQQSPCLCTTCLSSLFVYVPVSCLIWLGLVGLVIAVRPQTPKQIKGGWSHYTDTSKPVDGNRAQNMVTVLSRFLILSCLWKLVNLRCLPSMGASGRSTSTGFTRFCFLVDPVSGAGWLRRFSAGCGTTWASSGGCDEKYQQ